MARLWLVTGGAGFIGSHLVDRLLADGDEVRVLDDLSTGKLANLDARVDLCVGDVAHPAVVRSALRGAAGVFHLAAIASVQRANEDPVGAHRVNQSASVAVFSAAREEGRRRARSIPVVYASSSAVYGEAGPRADERLAPSPLSAYAVDKLGTELHARVASSLHGVPTLGLRFFNVYGQRQDPSSPYSGVISILAARIAAGRPVRIDGDGRQTRDFVHVGDVVAHLTAAMTALGDAREAGLVLNVCTGRAVSIAELASLMAAALGRTLRVEHGPARAGDVRHSCGSPDAAVAALGLRAAIELEAGLATLLQGLPGE